MRQGFEPSGRIPHSSARLKAFDRIERVRLAWRGVASIAPMQFEHILPRDCRRPQRAEARENVPLDREANTFGCLERVVNVHMLGEIAIEQFRDARRGAERLAIVDGIEALADGRQRLPRRLARPVRRHHAEPSKSEPTLAPALVAILDDE